MLPEERHDVGGPLAGAGFMRSGAGPPPARGEELLMLSAHIFEELRADWAQQLGTQRLRALEEDLATMVGRGGPAALAV
jgi:hypothetical protein